MTNRPALNRDRLPEALRNVALERLSSGALMLLDRNGDLVQPPSWAAREKSQTSAAKAQAETVALDPRVASNIRLGDDPPPLPDNMRAQAEPHIVRSQTEPDLVLATFQEGRFTDGGAVNCGYSVSQDGGLTWTRALIPGLTMASGGPYFRATDPVAGAGLNNNLYLNTLAATEANFDAAELVISRSTDRGATFAPPVVIYRPPSASIFPDKNWMTINNFPGQSTSGRILVTFTRFTGTRSPIARSYSDDDGLTWSSATLVHASSTPAQGSQPVFLPNGRVAIIYFNFGDNNNAAERLEAVLSSNGGVTFGAPRFITNVVQYAPPNIRSGTFLPSATTDRTTPNIYVVYQGIQGGAPRILFTKSTNAGFSWSAPISISDNPSGSGVFNSAIAASPDGQTLTAAFYDQRDNPGPNTLVDMYLAQSFDGGATWQPNIRLTSISSDASLAPLTDSGYMLGDYLGVAEATSAGVPAIPVWVDTRTGNPDPFVARVGIAPQFDFPSFQAGRLSLAQINDPESGGEGGDADGDREDNFSEFNSLTDPNDPNSVVRSARLLNISTRARVESGDNALIGGFIITGDATSSSKRVMIRALGPSLATSGVPGPLQDPTLELHVGGETIFNDDWSDAQTAEIQATGIPPADRRESAIVRSLARGSYTAIMRGKDGSTGVGLIEVYDLEESVPPRLANISTRGLVGTQDNVMIGGFIIGDGFGTNGAGSARIVVRGIGPSLTQLGVPDALQDPLIELHDVNGAVIASNENWKETQQMEIEASGLMPKDEREAALITTLVQGNYTAIVRGEDQKVGVALVEVYNVPAD